jgi:sensor histidine kinase YesM
MDPGKLASIGSSANPSPSVGVTNIDMRLRRLYGTGLEIKSEKGKGTKVAVSIPLTERNHQ